MGTRDLFGESFLDNINGKSALKPYTEFDDLQNKLRLQLELERNPLQKYTKIIDKYRKDSTGMINTLAHNSNEQSKIPLQYFERVHMAQMKSKNSLTLEQAVSQ